MKQTREHKCIKAEGIVNIKDLLEFEDDDINNVITNLRQPQDIWHLTRDAVVGCAEVAANPNAVPLMLFLAAVLQRARVIAWTEK